MNTVTETLKNSNLGNFGGYLTDKTSAKDAAELMIREMWRQRGQIFGLQRLPKPLSDCPSEYQGEFTTGYDQGIGQTLTKSGVKAALISLGYSEFPKALESVNPSKSFISEEKDFAKYLIHDTDFGGAWNDEAQINMHLK